MAYTRTYHTTVPVLPDADRDLMRWLARESFEVKAEGDGLRIVTYAEDIVPAEDIPPKAGKQLGRPVTDYEWFRFTATATNEPPEPPADA